MLASTSYSTESATPGSGRGGVPERYNFTARGRNALNPWNDETYKYSITQLYMGSNFNSNLEVVSALNTFNIGRVMYAYEYGTCLERYYAKVYVATPTSISYRWIYDDFGPENVQKIDPNTWPQNFGQSSQKGEANI